MESASSLARRLRKLDRRRVLGSDFPTATGLRARLLGLVLLPREAAGPGLLIPRCRSVHTFGMRFPLDLHFLDEHGVTLAVRREVSPARFVSHRGASMVLEIPSEGCERFSAL